MCDYGGGEITCFHCCVYDVLQHWSIYVADILQTVLIRSHSVFDAVILVVFGGGGVNLRR